MNGRASEASITFADGNFWSARLPVIDGHRLVGMVTFADVAGALEEPETGLVLQAITEG